MKPFWAFSLGVLVNVPLGFLLSAVVFARYWANLLRRGASLHRFTRRPGMRGGGHSTEKGSPVLG